MNILISENGIRNNQYESYRVSGVNSVREVSRQDPETMREAEKRFAAENSPAILVDISSQGKAALASMKSLGESMSNFRSSYNYDNKLQLSVGKDTTDNEKINNTVVQSDTAVTTITDTTADTESSESSVSTAPTNLSIYSESQLRSMQREGTISITKLNDEIMRRAMEAKAEDPVVEAGEEIAKEQSGSVSMSPVFSQAMAAYSFQMAISNGQISA